MQNSSLINRKHMMDGKAMCHISKQKEGQTL